MRSAAWRSASIRASVQPHSRIVVMAPGGSASLCSSGLFCFVMLRPFDTLAFNSGHQAGG
ncbi:MAG: hypothetical protein B7X36_01000 [Thiomonas sp. 14-64-326]|nr:MAG: hypothetical protein B7X36_01000 [Thiomonas sp. 14-64-326]